MNSRFIAFGLGLILSLPATTAGGEGIQVSVTPLNPTRGGIVLLRARAPGFTDISGSRGEDTLHFFPSGEKAGDWLALVPFDLGELPGRYQIRISARASSGQEEVIKRELSLLSGEFGRRELTLPPHLVNPPESEVPRILKERDALREIFQTVSEEWKGNGSFILPFPGFHGDNFGEERILNGERRSPHSGVDCSVPEGTPVRATNSGTVVMTQSLYYEGNTVIIDHGLGIYTIYIHLQKFRVEAGNTVQKGEIIGWVGQTGRATGPHLHFGAKIGGKRVDPVQLMVFRLE